MAIKIVERYSVSPSDEGGAVEQTLPLVYFDMVFLQAPPTETLYFYDIKCSESCFLETFVVKLKHSLSITLKHFLPLASKVVFSLSSDDVPVSRYAAGDSVALTVAVSGADFANLTGNHPTAADEFHNLVTQLPPADYSSDDVRFSPIAIQVTLFPNQGVCLGFTHHHAICDVTSLIAFIHAWASIHKFDGEDVVQLPFFGRGFVQNANELDRSGWNQIVKTCKPTVSLTNSPLPTHKFRATFILSDAQIGKLKKFAMITKPGMGSVSSFVVVCAYLWSCLAKSAAAAGEEVADDEPEYFISPVECRARLNPPLPETYFGNCLVLLQAESSHGRLKGSEGFAAAVEAIAPVIRSSNLINGEWIMDFFENQFQGNSEWIGKRRLWVSGSSRIDHYGADYGWGRGIKYECIHTDFDGSVNLCKARDHGGIEIGLSMPWMLSQISSTIIYTSIAICNMSCSPIYIG